MPKYLIPSANNRKPREIEVLVDANGCHEVLNRKKGSRGYSVICLNSKSRKLHRWIYEFYNGVIPAGLVVRHKCDVKHCINPEHLELGTVADNNNDRKVRGRNNSVVGQKHPQSRLSNEQVLEIFNDHISTQESLAIRFKVCQTAIWKIKTGKTWKHITKQSCAA